jgi:hypothetical protein
MKEQDRKAGDIRKEEYVKPALTRHERLTDITAVPTS